MSAPPRQTEWIKATASNQSGQCIEMRRNGAVIEIRDTKQGTNGPILSFAPAEFAAWIDGATKDEFHQLL